jgi:hypothetical protein
MSNISLYLPLVDGSLRYYIEETMPTIDVVNAITGDDYAAPPQSLTIEVKTESGKKVKVIIPYERKGKVIVMIDDEKI